MTTPDTTPEAVERLCKLIHGPERNFIIANIRALAAERDAAQRELRAALVAKGGNEHYPTEWAYAQSCRVIDEQYDTQMEVERNPCGAWQAIQALAAENAALRADNDMLRGALGKLQSAAGEVSRQGAVHGPQWTRLNVALLSARAALDAKP